MRALYLYFAETARPSGDRPRSIGDDRPVDDGPLIPIKPGAFSRWMANRERDAAGPRGTEGHAVTGSAPQRRPIPAATR